MHAIALPPVADCRLWQVDLDDAPAPQMLGSISPGEQARAQRFVFERDRRRFLAAHAALREVLAHERGIDAGALRFCEGLHGKPSLQDMPDLHFNLSHSQAVGLIAVADAAEVGIDVEVLRPMPDALALAEAHFSENERRALQAMTPGAERDMAFFRGWTRKEACLKAIGAGLSLDTRSFEVGIGAGTREVVLHTAAGARCRLRLVSVPLAIDAVAALACALPLHDSGRAAAHPTEETCS